MGGGQRTQVGHHDDGEDHMKAICAILALFIGLFAVEGMAADASKPDAASIINAMDAAVGVGNVDAAVSFFADDGYNISPSGKKTVGKNDLRTLIENVWIPENLQTLPARDVKIQGEHSVFNIDISTTWLSHLGVTPIQAVNIVDIEGNRIKSIVAYWPPSSLEKLTQACDAHPDIKTTSGTPCGDVMRAFKKYTDNLIAQGIIEKD